ncbi:solute carrier family 35 member G1-like [Ptychodera flava]|uniref:solute carrier family 35 member G1-like n=1 Tax=Ptychodera flava TaxID=63121 RepID=UPI00396A29D1
MGGSTSTDRGEVEQVTEYDSILRRNRSNGSTVTDRVDEETGRTEEEKSRNCWASIAGVVYALTSGICLGFSDVFVLLGMNGGVAPAQQLLIKSIVMVLVIVPLMLYKSISLLAIEKRDVIYNICKGFAENGADIAFYYSLAYIGIGDASAIALGFLPIFSQFMACIFLRDKLQIVDWITTAVSLVGILLITRPDFIFGSAEHSDSDWLGYVLTVIAPLLLGSGAIFTRLMTRDLSILVVMLFNGLCGIVISIPMLFLPKTENLFTVLKNNMSVIGYMVGMIALYLPYCLTFNRALQLETAAKVTLLFNIQVICGFLADVLIFGLVPSWLEFTGGGLVLLSSFLAALSSWWTNTQVMKK